MLKNLKGEKGFSKEKEVSLFHLTNFHKTLDIEKNKTLYIKKQIKNEIQLGYKVEKLLDTSFAKINEESVDLVRKFSEEKQKNEKLEVLVKMIEEQIYDAKLQKYEDLKNKIETDKLEEQSGMLKNKERDLDRVIEKANTSSYEISKKIDSIRALRSERTIFSTVFDKIEKQLCNLEHCYKILVIERNISEFQYKQKVQDFNNFQHFSIKQYEKVVQRLKNTNQSEERSIKTKTKINSSQAGTIERYSSYNVEEVSILPHKNLNQTIDTNLEKKTSKEIKENKENKEKEKQSTIKINRVRQEEKNQFKKIQFQTKIKNIFNDLQINNISQFPSDQVQLQKQNHQIFQEANNLFNLIEEYKEKIENLKNIKVCKDRPNLSRKTHIYSLKERINQTIKSTDESKTEIKQFIEGLKDIHKNKLNLKPSDNSEEFFNQDEQLKYYMIYLSQIFSNLSISFEDKKEFQKNIKKAPSNEKRLSTLLSANNVNKNLMSYYEEKDLQDIAKINIERASENK